MNSQQDVFKLTQSYLYYNSNAAIDSGKPVNAEPTTCSKSKHVLKDLLGTIENLNNKLKTLSNDIRTISKS